MYRLPPLYRFRVNSMFWQDFIMVYIEKYQSLKYNASCTNLLLDLELTIGSILVLQEKKGS